MKHNPDRVDWSQFERIGISRETLEKTGNLEKLLNRQKTDLLPISPKFDDVTLRTDARLALRENADPNSMTLRYAPTHGWRCARMPTQIR